jgi:hypothetical protein
MSHPRRDIPKAMRLITENTFHPERVTTLLANWEDGAEAYLEKTTKLILKRAPLQAPPA